MSEKPTIGNLMDVTMDKIRDMVDVEAIIGDPIVVSETITIIPVSKVSYGFASGGSDLPTKTPKDLFGGGAGAGISIQPVAFLVVNDGVVSLLRLDESSDALSGLVSALPSVAGKVTDLIKSSKKDKKDKKKGKNEEVTEEPVEEEA